MTKTHVDIMDIVAQSREMQLYFDAAVVTMDVGRDISFVAFHSFFNTNKFSEIAATAKSEVEVTAVLALRYSSPPPHSTTGPTH